MAIARRKRRKIVVDRRLFLWSLHEEDVNELHIVSDDKHLNLRYGWQHALPPGERYVDVMGPGFNGLPPGLHGWIRVKAPDWTDPSYAGSPAFVRKIIQWALEPKTRVIFKQLPEHFSTHVVTAAPWNLGLLTFTASPGDTRTFDAT